MDFFEHQEQAKRKTGRLVLLFSLAVATLIAGIYFVIKGMIVWIYGMESGLFSYSYMQSPTQPSSRSALFWQWDPEIFWWVTLGTLLVVLLGSMYKIVELRGGGAAVALSLGGRLVDRSTRNPQERQLLNVVDEMAIASGIATPPVYVLEHEPGINAFAAGYSPDDAVVAATQGCMDILSREQLQGVVAHEFSHILNGDMRLNIHLMGLIHGILVIGLTGRVILRGPFHRARFGYRMHRQSGKAALAAMAIGGSLMAIGFMGVLFGNLIKAAVSRQREFLADASAVQFTRNPSGLAGALKKIGGLAEGSVMLDPKSEAASHMFFSQGLSGNLGNALATHPPLTERIRRIEPSFNGRFPVIKQPEPEQIEQPATAPAVMPLAQTTRRPVQATRPVSTQPVPDPIAQIGNPNAAHLEYASTLLASLPDQVRDAAHDPYGARALVYALLLNKNADIRQVQEARLTSHADTDVRQETLRLESSVKEVDPAARLPLIDMAIPTLGELSASQYRVFKTNVLELIHADQQVELFEWMLRHVLLRHLEPKFRTVKKKAVQYYSLKRLGEQCAGILSALAYQAHRDDNQAKLAFDRGARYLQIPGIALLPRNRCGLSVIDYALDTLVQASPREKRKILQACAACVLSDNQVTVEESEVLRAVADSLGCPMPPLLAGQQVATPQEAVLAG